MTERWNGCLRRRNFLGFLPLARSPGIKSQKPRTSCIMSVTTHNQRPLRRSVYSDQVRYHGFGPTLMASWYFDNFATPCPSTVRRWFGWFGLHEDSFFALVYRTSIHTSSSTSTPLQIVDGSWRIFSRATWESLEGWMDGRGWRNSEFMFIPVSLTHFPSSTSTSPSPASTPPPRSPKAWPRWPNSAVCTSSFLQRSAWLGKKETFISDPETIIWWCWTAFSRSDLRENDIRTDKFTNQPKGVRATWKWLRDTFIISKKWG